MTRGFATGVAVFDFGGEEHAASAHDDNRRIVLNKKVPPQVRVLLSGANLGSG